MLQLVFSFFKDILQLTSFLFICKGTVPYIGSD
nr:MAG TPA: hypothetical protein [Caudoviricetes sp.]